MARKYERNQKEERKENIEISINIVCIVAHCRTAVSAVRQEVAESSTSLNSDNDCTGQQIDLTSCQNTVTTQLRFGKIKAGIALK